MITLIVVTKSCKHVLGLLINYVVGWCSELFAANSIHINEYQIIYLRWLFTSRCLRTFITGK